MYEDDEINKRIKMWVVGVGVCVCRGGGGALYRIIWGYLQTS